jgi:hypothetical protein
MEKSKTRGKAVASASARGRAVKAKTETAVVAERKNFRLLLAGNPNYFGTIKGSAFKPVKAMASNTGYEELKCVGFNPQFGRLEAVVYVKRQSGYGGGLCSQGSTEYVRFFLSFDDGATWQDRGFASFKVHDMPGPRPLEYAVTLGMDPEKKWCWLENLPKVRAILSWNDLPDPAQPNQPPVWGNVLDARIQVDARRLFFLRDVLAEAKVKLPPTLQTVLDVDQPITAAMPKMLTMAEKHALYRDTKVPAHRYLYQEVHALTASAGSTSSLASSVQSELAKISVDVAKVIATLLKTDGNTDYEEMTCIGLDPNEESLVGVIKVKLSSGYSGNLCQPGSQEYIAFWEWDEIEQMWHYLGTTSVRVHDVKNIPASGLFYAAALPVDFSRHRRPCGAGPVVVRIRAIMSWQVPPPPDNPEWVPTWGNREETRVHVKPGPAVGDERVPFLSSVGDVPEMDIDGSGKATGACIHTGLLLNDSPFGGRITLAGRISFPVPGLKYRIVRKLHGAPDTTYVPITNEPTGLDLILDTWDLLNGWVQQHITRHADPQGYYPYEDYSWSHAIETDLMGVWFSTAADDGQTFDLRIDLSVDGDPDHDVHSNVVTVLVDNTAPEVALDINVGIGVQCAHFKPAETFSGHYKATDAHFLQFQFEIQPAGPPNNPPHGVLPSPASGSSVFYGGAIADPGVAAGTYTLNTGLNPGPPPTGPMDSCGYALILHVWDRTNVNSGGGRNYNKASVGFCVGEPKK